MIGLCGFQVFNQGVNWRLLPGNFVISVSRWSQRRLNERERVSEPVDRSCEEGEGYAHVSVCVKQLSGLLHLPSHTSPPNVPAGK